MEICVRKNLRSQFFLYFRLFS